MRNLIPLFITAALGIGFTILWSSAFTMGKMAVATSPPLSFLTIRFFIATCVILLMLKFMKIPVFSSWREFKTGSALGLLNNAAYLGLCWIAFTSTSAGMVAIIAGLNPLITALIAHLWLKEPLGIKRILGMVLGLGGAWWVIVSRLDSGLHIESTIGIILTFIAMLALSTGTLIYRRYGRDENNHPWRLNMVQSLAAGIILFPFATQEDWSSIQFGMDFFLIMSYSVIVISVISLLMWFALIRRVGAAGASAFHFLNPAMALFFAWIILGETVDFHELLGVAPVLIGILLVNWPAKPSPKPNQKPNIESGAV